MREVTVPGRAPHAAVLLAGVYNLAVFFFYSVPIPVQPMHTIAGVAISDGLSAGEVTAAGILVGAAVLLLSVTRTIDYLNRFIPLALVRGIQLGVGLALFRRAFTQDYIFASPWSAWDGPAVACIAVALLLVAAVRVDTPLGARRGPVLPLTRPHRAALHSGAAHSPARSSCSAPQPPSA